MQFVAESGFSAFFFCFFSINSVISGEKNWNTDNISKNAPNILPRISAFAFAASRLPPTEQAHAGIIIHKSPSFLTRPFFICTNSDTAAIGANAARFIACAVFCPTEKNIVSAGISTVPPPIPIPPKTPEAAPASASKTAFNISEKREFYARGEHNHGEYARYQTRVHFAEQPRARRAADHHAYPRRNARLPLEIPLGEIDDRADERDRQYHGDSRSVRYLGLHFQQKSHQRHYYHSAAAPEKAVGDARGDSGKYEIQFILYIFGHFYAPFDYYSRFRDK